MGILNQSQLERKFKTNVFSKIYLFAEQNEFEKECTIALLTRIIFPDGMTPFNQDLFSFPGSTVHDVLSSCMMLPFGSAKRLVRVKGIEHCTIAQQKQIAEGFPAVPSSTILILEAHEPKRSIQNKHIVKVIRNEGEVVYFWRPRVEDLPRIITQRVRDEGKTISPDAARFLADQIGDEQNLLVQEIEKLLIYCADQRVIGIKETAAMCGQSSVHNMFDLRDSMQARNAKKSVYVLKQLCADRVEPVVIVHTLYQTFRRLLLAKLMMEEKNMSREETESLLHVNAYYEKHFFQDLNCFTKEELCNNLLLLSEADEEIKTGRAEPQGKLTALVLLLAGGQQMMKLAGKP
ncbi:MAG: DNA polymerase III subunit delta [Elusimicrobia bacterium]|nr:DNA polymerase III subunit delta [Elusimicrobiota bacterium]MBD3412581.1 DNA polymerase III subunit delta [Elusimicrobiota bacterium]